MGTERNYTKAWKMGEQAVTATAIKLTPPAASLGEAVTVLFSSPSAFQYSSDEAGPFKTAGLNSQTSLYEKLVPVALAFDQTWIKSTGGSITVSWEALIENKAN